MTDKEKIEVMRRALEIVRDKWKDCSDSCLTELSDIAEKALFTITQGMESE